MDEMERVERGLSSNLNWRWVAIQQRQHSCPQPLRMSDPPGVQPHRANVPVCDCFYLYVQVLKSNSSQFPPSRKDGIFVYKYHSPDNSKPSMPLKMLPQNTWHITGINQATPLGAQRPCVARTKLSLGTRILIEFSLCPRRDSPAEGRIFTCNWLNWLQLSFALSCHDKSPGCSQLVSFSEMECLRTVNGESNTWRISGSGTVL